MSSREDRAARKRLSRWDDRAVVGKIDRIFGPSVDQSVVP